jgi:hypothetical protein
MAQDILPNLNPGILPGDSMVVEVTDPVGIATDPLLGSPSGPAVYTYIRILRDIYTPPPSDSPPQVALAKPPPQRGEAESDDERNPLRYPYVGDAVCDGDTFWIYRMDSTFTSGGGLVADRFCFDLNDDYFLAGDTIQYFFCAENTSNVKSYWSRRMGGRGVDFVTNDLEEVCSSPMEFTILPGGGYFRGGDILFIDDADDRGGPAQLYFDCAFEQLQIDHLVDRFDVLGPSSAVGNSLASRVKNVLTQLIGDPDVVYQKILWNSGSLSSGLVGDGGPPSGGSGADKSDDWSLLNTFMNLHPNNPGIALWGDDLAEEWATLTGAGAVAFRGSWMNFTLLTGNHASVAWGLNPSEKVKGDLPESIYVLFDQVAAPPAPPMSDTYMAYGGCPLINDFDVLAPAGPPCSEQGEYVGDGSGAVLAQATANAAATTARCVLSGHGFNYIRNEVPSEDAPPHTWMDRAEVLWDILTWFENLIPEPIGVDPVAFENRLENSYPNPFNSGTTIAYSVKEQAHVKLKIYNVAGQLVKTLVNEEKTPRKEGFVVRWDGTNNADQPVSSGVYFYRLVTKNFLQTKKMVVIK